MLIHFIKTAWRNIKRNKIYSIINVTGLALGITAFALISLYILDELRYDRFNKNAGRIVRLVQHSRWNGNEMHQATTSAPFAFALKQYFPEIEETVRIDLEGGGVISFDNKKINQNDIIFADASILNIFTYDFLIGTARSAAESPDAFVITESLANKIFGSPEKAFQQTVYFDGNYPARITAVIKDIPNHSHLRFSGLRLANPNYFNNTNWQNQSIYTYLLLKAGTDIQALENKFPAFAEATVQKASGIRDYNMELQPLTAIHLKSNLSFELSPNGSITRVYLFAAIAILILIIAVINYTNLTTARSITRVKEVGIRKVIGSDKKHIAGLFISEAILVTGLASVVAYVLMQLSLPYFNQITSKQMSFSQLGWTSVISTLILFATIIGLVCGAYPSFFISGFKTIPALKNQFGNQQTNLIFRKSLVVFQFVITIVLIAAAWIIYQQLTYARNSSLGFNKDQLLTFHINNRAVRKQIPAIKQQLLANPVIQGVAVAGNPIGNNDLGGMGYRFETAAGNFETATVAAQELMIDEDFLPTMEIKIQQGRNFQTNMPSDQYGAALINETLLKKLGWENAIGKKIQFTVNADTRLERTIVGVVKDFNTYSLQHKIEPLVMVMPPSDNAKDNLYVKIARGKIKEGLAYVEHQYKVFDRDTPTSYHFLNDNFARQYEAEEKQGNIAFIFSTLAIVIACLGLFGLATFTALQRTKEIGIRKILGARTGSLIGLLSREFLLLVGIAGIVAFPLAWLIMNKWLDGFVYRIQVQWWVLAAAAGLAACLALVTVSFQAIKTARANPVKALRTE